MLFTDVLKESKVFSSCYKAKYVSCSFAVCYFKRNKTALNRFGITAGKKTGCAVQRNRAKRIIRAAYRNCEKYVPIGYDMVFVARKEILEKKSDDVEWFIMKRVIPAINSAAENSDKHDKQSKQNKK